eukprot:7046629-Alexandrium_andersonii.AAC.1
MSASLVGSEMCIRDRCEASRTLCARERGEGPRGARGGLGKPGEARRGLGMPESVGRPGEAWGRPGRPGEAC